jgi:hypothetical protein
MALADLRKYAKKHKRDGGPRCLTCALPPELLAEIRQGRTEGISFPLLSGYLRAKGHDVRANTLQNHWQEHEQK